MDNEFQSEHASARYRDCSILIISLLVILFLFAGILSLSIFVQKNGYISEIDQNGEEKFYFYVDSEKQHGFCVVKYLMRYFDPADGHMVTGKCIIDGKEYYFLTDSGSMAVNRTIKFDDGTAVHYDRNGNPQAPTTPGLFTEEDGTLALNGTNGKLTGWRTVDGKTYYFQKITGRMLKNETAYIDGKIYNFDENGQATGVTE